MKNLHETFLAQYANSPRITGILKRFNKAVDPRPLIETFLTDVLDPLTATGWGLDVWGRIVGVSRVLKIPVEDSFFGFSEALEGPGATGIEGFNQAPFYIPSDQNTQNYALTDDAFRKLIFAKAAANITDGSIQDINRILMILFGDDDKKIWVNDIAQAGPFFGFAEAGDDFEPFGDGVFFNEKFMALLNMTMTICYDFEPSPVEITLINSAANFVRPSGVQVKFQYIAPTPKPPAIPEKALWDFSTGYLITNDSKYLTP